MLAGYGTSSSIRFEYFSDQSVAFESFKSGAVDFYLESSARGWAKNYDFPALNSGHVVKRRIDLKNSEPMQSFTFNLRKPKFQDARVRQAFNFAFDFEWSNKNLFYDQYLRTDSYFENQDLASSGLPQGRELEILKSIEKDVPPEVFTTEYKNPASDGSGQDRKLLRQAAKLLKDAGWSIKGGKLINDKTGEAMVVEFLLDSPTFERVVLPLAANLQRLGIKSDIRVVDDTQYVRRVQSFDFDIIVATYPQSESPGNEQRDFWGSKAADTPGSRNLIGIKNPAVDKLIDLIILAKDRAELEAATHALDRVLLWNHYVVPQWYVPFDRVAYWDKFVRPDPGPSRYTGFPAVWWYDKDKASKVEPFQKK